MSYSVGFSSVYDEYTLNVDYSAEADYIINILEKAGVKGRCILDAACGTGSLSVELLERGCEVIGVDISEEMLNIAREKTSEFGNRSLLLCQDLCELDLFGTVDCAVCMLDSLNHLDGLDSVRKAIEKMFLFLEPGGVIIFDMNTPYKHQKVLADNTFVYENENSFLVWQNELCDDNMTVNIYLDIFVEDKDGKYDRFSEDFSETAYSSDTIINLLKDTGFEDIRLFAEDGTPNIGEDEQRCRFVAVKPEFYREKMQYNG